MDKYCQGYIMDALISVKLKGSEIFFGNGIAELLEKIDETHSLAEACGAMNMAYSKAWKIIKRAEKELSCNLIERKTGGSGGGGSILTQEGREFLERYLSFRKDVEEYAKQSFEKFF